MLTQHVDSCASNLVFLYPCGWCVAAQKLIVVRSLVPWLFYPSFLSNQPWLSAWYSQYGSISSLTSALIDCQPYITWTVSAFKWSPACVVCLISFAIKYAGMSVHVSVALIIQVIPVISSSLPSIWLSLDSWLAILSHRHSLYRIFILYWCMHSRIHCNFCDRQATFFFCNMTTNVLWSVMFTSQLKHYSWNFPRPLGMPNAFLSMILYLVFALEKLLLENPVGHSTKLLGVILMGATNWPLKKAFS